MRKIPWEKNLSKQAILFQKIFEKKLELEGNGTYIGLDWNNEFKPQTDRPKTPPFSSNIFSLSAISYPCLLLNWTAVSENISSSCKWQLPSTGIYTHDDSYSNSFYYPRKIVVGS